MNQNLLIIASLLIVAIVVTVIVVVVTKKNNKPSSSCVPKSSLVKISKDPFVGSLTSAVWKGEAHPLRYDPSKYQTLKTAVDSYVPLQDGSDNWCNTVKLVDEVNMKIACQLALQAVAKGNFGIGVTIYDTKGDLVQLLQNATLTDPQVGGTIKYSDYLSNMLGILDPSYNDPNHPNASIIKNIVGLGFNQLFNQGVLSSTATPHVRSDRHGEMVAMDLLEDAIASVPGETSFQTKFPDGVVLYTQLESCPMCFGRLASSSIGTVRHGAPDNGGGVVSRSCGLPPVFIDLLSYQTWEPAYVSGNPKDPTGTNHLVGLCLNSFSISVADVGSKQNHRACTNNGGVWECPHNNYCWPGHSPAMLNRAGYDLGGFVA